VSILSLNKSLLNSLRESEGVVPEAPAENYLDVASRMLAAVRRSVLVGECFADLFEEMESIRKDLLVESGPQAVNNCAMRMEGVLAKYQNRLRQKDEERAADFRSVLAILNEAIHYLAAGSRQSENGRQQLENELTLAAQAADIAALRSHLAKILPAVRDESRRGEDAPMDNLGPQIQQVYQAQSRFASRLPGRGSAIEYLKPLVESVSPPDDLRMAIFAMDSLRMIRDRHGEEVASTIVEDLGVKQLQPLFPESKLFRWSANALLLVWRDHDPSKAAADALAGLKPSYEQRAFVGARMAVFSITLRSLVVAARGGMENWTETCDRFARPGGAC
jgi:hypothetical protein